MRATLFSLRFYVRLLALRLGFTLAPALTTRYGPLRRSLRQLLRPHPSARVLDVGSGPGALLVPSLAQRPQDRWTALDADAAALALAQSLVDQSSQTRGRTTFLRWHAAETLPAGDYDAIYDVIICAAMLQYVEQPAALLTQLAASLATDGALLLYVPVVPRRWLPAFDRWNATTFAHVHYDALHSPKSAFTEESLLETLAEARLRVTSVERITGWPGQWQYEVHTLLLNATRAWGWPAPIAALWLPLGALLVAADHLHGHWFPHRQANGRLIIAKRTLS